jgi:hypothetical protein
MLRKGRLWHSSLEEHMVSMPETVGSIPSNTKISFLITEKEQSKCSKMLIFGDLNEKNNFCNFFFKL